MTNILTTEFYTKYDTAPFSLIKLEDYQPAFEIDKTAKEEIDEIVANSEEPNFNNTIAALDYTGKL